MSMLREHSGGEQGGKVSMTRVASVVCVGFACVLALASLGNDTDVAPELIIYFLAAGTVPKVFQRLVEGKFVAGGKGANEDEPP